MKRGLMIITKSAVYLMAIALVGVCAILLPELAREEAMAHPGDGMLTFSFLIGAWVLAIPIFIALYQTLKLIKYIDNDKSFSELSIKALRKIKYCALIFSALVVLGAGAVVLIAQGVDPNEDVTPVFTIGFIFTFVSLVVATFTAVLQKLFSNAIELKTENELTV